MTMLYEPVVKFHRGGRAWTVGRGLKAALAEIPKTFRETKTSVHDCVLCLRRKFYGEGLDESAAGLLLTRALFPHHGRAYTSRGTGDQYLMVDFRACEFENEVSEIWCSVLCEGGDESADDAVRDKAFRGRVLELLRVMFPDDEFKDFEESGESF